MDNYKRQIEQQLVEIIASSLTNGSLTEEDLPTIANFAIPNVKQIKNHDQIIGFLSELSIKWPVFGSIALQEEGKLKRHIEAHVAQNVLNLIHHNQVKQAVALANSYIK